jgi:hypothetical protein
MFTLRDGIYLGERRVTYGFDTPKPSEKMIRRLNDLLLQRRSVFYAQNSVRWAVLRFGPITLREVNKQWLDKLKADARDHNKFLLNRELTNTQENQVKNVRFYINFGPRPRRPQCCCQTWGDCHSCACKELRQAQAMMGDIEKVADLILRTIPGLSLGQRQSLQHRRNTWVNCTAEEFGLFIVRRNDAGLQNNVKAIRPRVVGGAASRRMLPSHIEELNRRRPQSENDQQIDMFSDAVNRTLKEHRLVEGESIQVTGDSYTAMVSRQIRKVRKKRHIFFVLNGVRYQAPEWLRLKPKQDGWYICTEGEPYVASEPFDTETEARAYMVGM